MRVRERKFACWPAAERDSTGPPQVSQGPSRYTSNHDLPNSRSEARSANQSTQLRAHGSAAMSRPPLPAEAQASRQTSREQPVGRLPDPQAQPMQEAGSGYASTESDSDTGTNERAQVCWVT